MGREFPYPDNYDDEECTPELNRDEPSSDFEDENGANEFYRRQNMLNSGITEEEEVSQDKTDLDVHLMGS